jgi:hypothetical protein
MLHRIVLFAHVLSAFLYLLAHGTSVAVAYRVRREVSAERVRALLDLSRSSVGVANYLLLSAILFGVVLGFLGHWWSSGWIWVSLATLVIVFGVMGRMVAPHFRRMRAAVGSVLVDGAEARGAHDSTPDELARALAAGRPAVVTGLAVAGWAVILWMMLFKPF